MYSRAFSQDDKSSLRASAPPPLLSGMRSVMQRSGLDKRADTQLPAPISIPPSLEFDGNDGPWSSFQISIGTPPQTVKVLISTASSQTWAILPEGCAQSDQANCTISRGGAFEPTNSSSWNNNTATANALFPLLLDNSILNYTAGGQYGFDNVTLGGPGGPSLDKQAVAGIVTEQFHLGLFGLNPQTSTLPDATTPLPDFITQLNQSGSIPSLAWSYTAGNQYRPGPFYGSLTLGGFDASRFEPNNITFSLDAADPGNFTVNIGAIILTTDDNTTVLTGPNNSIPALIDSTTPYIYFPLYLCQQFEKAFGIEWNGDVQAYLVNDTLHQALQSQDTSIVFNLGNSSTTPGQGFNISFPYSAFDLIAEAPLVPNATRYFPLMRSANESQYTLGRTFLQEAYLIADYERNNFSVSQCSWDAGTQSHIVAIRPPGFDASSPSHKTSAGGIAGIVVGCVVILLLLASLGIWVKFRNRQKVSPGQSVGDVAELDAKEKDPFTPDDMDKSDFQHYRHAELDTVEHKGHEIDGQPRSPPQVVGEEQRFELAATERHSRTLSSPISAMTARSDATRLHKREMSDPISVTTEGSDAKSQQSEPISPGGESQTSPRSSRSLATWLHKRDLSDPVSVGTAGADAIEEHRGEQSEPVSPTTDSPVSPRRTRLLATALHRRELSDPVSLATQTSEDAAQSRQHEEADSISPMKSNI